MRLRILAAAFCVCLIFGLTAKSFAEEEGGDNDFVAAEAVAAEDDSEEESEDSDEATSGDDDGDEVASDDEAEEDAVADSSDEAEEDEADDEDVPSWQRFQTATPEPVVEEKPAVEEEVVAEAPAAPEKPAKVKKEKQPKPAKYDDGDGFFAILEQVRFGVRAGLGMSAFQGHKAIYIPEFGPHAISLGALVNTSAGFVVAAPINELLSVTMDLQYSLYTAHGEYSIKTKGDDLGKLNQAGVELHSFEVPVLVNFNFQYRYYAEVGPQFGGNIYSKIYANNDLKKPYLNRFAFGPVVGGGFQINDDLRVGVRGYFGVIDYADGIGGKPWMVQAGVTSFFNCDR